MVSLNFYKVFNRGESLRAIWLSWKVFFKVKVFSLPVFEGSSVVECSVNAEFFGVWCWSQLQGKLLIQRSAWFNQHFSN